MEHKKYLVKMHLGRGCIVVMHDVTDTSNGGVCVDYTLVRRGTLSKRQRHKKMSGVLNFVLEQGIFNHHWQLGSHTKKQEERLARRQKWMDKNICFVV